MRFLGAVLLLLVLVGSVRGQELLPPPREAGPAPVVQPAPAPTPLAPFQIGPLKIIPVAPVPPPTGFYRTSAYDVWQNLSPDRYGRFKVRVVNTPAGAYYYYNGRPYPWMPPPVYQMGPPGTLGGPGH